MLFNVVSHYSDTIDNGRTLQDIFNAAEDEMCELQTEILYHEDGMIPGEDGVVGEAIDVIACLMDIIHRYDPKITEEELERIMIKKCKKWQRKAREAAGKQEGAE